MIRFAKLSININQILIVANIKCSLNVVVFIIRPSEEIVIEARKRIGENGYSITTQNCQHFVSEIRNGTAISPE